MDVARVRLCPAIARRAMTCAAGIAPDRMSRAEVRMSLRDKHREMVSRLKPTSVPQPGNSFPGGWARVMHR